jgi:fructokinase
VKIISMGEVLWDIFDDQELLGGAPLNISASLQRLGHSVSLVTGVGTDARGERTLERMAKLCLSTEFVRRAPDRETGTARVTLNGLGQATFVIPRPAAFDSLQGDAALLSRLQALGSEWLYFGTLAQTDALNCELVEQMFEQLSGIRGFYDMNLREGHWNLPLVQRLSTLAAHRSATKVFARAFLPGVVRAAQHRGDLRDTGWRRLRCVCRGYLAGFSWI